MERINFDEYVKNMFSDATNKAYYRQGYDDSNKQKYDSTMSQIENYSPYKDQINQKLDQLTNWEYDPTQDASYQAMSKLYDYNGQKAMKNTLGQVSARTGGLASSYAGSAASQSYNDYMQQLAALAPQYEQNAYNKLSTSLNALQNQDNTEYSRLYNLASMYQNADNTEYNKWAQDLSNLNNLISMGQNVGSYLGWLPGTGMYQSELPVDYGYSGGGGGGSRSGGGGSRSGSGSGSSSSGSSGSTNGTNRNYDKKAVSSATATVIGSGAYNNNTNGQIRNTLLQSGYSQQEAAKIVNNVEAQRRREQEAAEAAAKRAARNTAVQDALYIESMRK